MKDQALFPTLFAVMLGWSMSAPADDGVFCNASNSPLGVSDVVDSDVLVAADEVCLIRGATINGAIVIDGDLRIEGATVSGDIDVNEGGTLEVRGNLGYGPTEIEGSVYSNGASKVDINATTDANAITIWGDLEFVNNIDSSCEQEVGIRGSVRASGNRRTLYLVGCHAEGKMRVFDNDDERTDPQPINIGFNDIGGKLKVFGNKDGVTITENTTGGKLRVFENLGDITINGNDVGEKLKVVDNSGDITITRNEVSDKLKVVDNLGDITIGYNTIGGNLNCDGNTNITDPGEPSNDVGGKAKNQCANFDISP